MSDILDEIINGLPPSTLRLLEFNSEQRLHSDGNINITKLLHNYQEFKNKLVNRKLKRRMYDIKSKIAENKSSVTRLQRELEALSCLKKTSDNEDSVKAYTAKIRELEAEVKNLTKDQAEVDLESLFSEIINLNEQIEDYRKKTLEAKKLYPFDEDFPLDVKAAEAEIEKVKESIKTFDRFIYSSNINI